MKHEKMTFLGFILLVIVTGAIGGLVFRDATMNWYYTLQQPTWKLPVTIYAPVWLIISALLGCCGALIWKVRKAHSVAMTFFWLLLILNFLWPFFFFGMKNLVLAGIDVSLLFISTAFLTTYASRVSKAAGWLAAPFLVWTAYHTILNWVVVSMN